MYFFGLGEYGIFHWNKLSKRQAFRMDHDLCKIKQSSVLTYLATQILISWNWLCAQIKKKHTVPANLAVRNGHITHIWSIVYKRKLLKAT